MSNPKDLGLSVAAETPPALPSLGGGRKTNKTFIDLNKAAYWFFPTEFDENLQAASQGYISGYDGVFGIDDVYNYKAFGSSARCVKNY